MDTTDLSISRRRLLRLAGGAGLATGPSISVVPTPIETAHRVAEELFARNDGVFGSDGERYRGHVHRVIGVIGLQLDVPEPLAQPLGVAAFFHDAGIWFDGTWDYLPPSIARADEEIGACGAGHADLVRAMIDEHHRLRPARHPEPIVEAFRRADLMDVTAGYARAPGVTAAGYAGLTRSWPATGFRPMLVRAFVRGLRENPLRPAPMVKV